MDRRVIQYPRREVVIMTRILCVFILLTWRSLAAGGEVSPTADTKDAARDHQPASTVERSAEAAPSDEDRYQSLDELFLLYQPYIGNISAYKPMYFLVGTQPEKSKFQISFKYRFFNPEGSFATAHPWVAGFHFAYTQTSFWDLASDSKPFEDTSYKPELFFLSSNIRALSSKQSRFFVQAGLEHESNGQAGTESRSNNYGYLRPIFIYYSPRNRIGIQVAPKIWGYLGVEEENNADFADYRGFFDLELKVGKADSLVLESHCWWARKGPSVQLDLTYPLHRFLFNNLDFYFQINYTNALAENLRNYTERTEALRLGLAIVR